MNILVTGSAGFIGSALTLKLLDRGDYVIGVDNHNDYYDPKLKEDRLCRYINHQNYKHFRVNLENEKDVNSIFQNENFDIVVNLAAQAGVRYSLENPLAYIKTNLLGFGHLIEAARTKQIKNFVYASSSSVYGLNTLQPFSTTHPVNHPVSLYAATKKSNELIAHTYSHLYRMPTTGLRFFTVYGPYDRPDMALQKFTKKILSGEPIEVFNYGKHKRDFTYIDDIVDGLIKIIDNPAKKDISWDSANPNPSSSSAPYKIYNIGNNKPVELMDYISALEEFLGVEAKKIMLPIQPGDVPDTYADISDIKSDMGYKPKTKVRDGVKNFVDWYLDYYD